MHSVSRTSQLKGTYLETAAYRPNLRACHCTLACSHAPTISLTRMFDRLTSQQLPPVQAEFLKQLLKLAAG